jgi:sialidase-1
MKVAIWAAVWVGWVAGAAVAAAGGVERQTLFRAGEGGYASYRIPAVIATTKGSVLAFCEGRRKSSSDTGEINILLRRSADGGRTFGPASVVWADGLNTCGNPCPVVDSSTGTVWLLLTHNLGVDHEPGLTTGESKGTRTVWVTSSTDDGVTWAEPREITADVKRPEWSWYATGPGVGIQIEHGAHAGRLVIPCDHVIRGGGPDAGNAHVIYSDDHGATWRIGGEPPERRYNESQVVELEDGSVMLNMRNARVGKRAASPDGRGVAVSTDGGATFGPAHADSALPEPICQGSILRHSWKDGGTPGTILFANPASVTKRVRMTVRVSKDDGKTWPVERVIWDGFSAYSCLVNLPGGDVGLLYEAGEKKGYERIEFARFGLEWVEGKE